MPAAPKTPDRPYFAALRSPRFVRWLAKRFVNLPMARKHLVAEAVTRLALARLWLVFIPFNSLAVWFGTVAKPGEAPSAPPQTAGEAEQARAIGWAVTRAARYVPFRAVCLPQAIAAKAMLERRGIASVMHFGVAKRTDEPLAAHAWLDSGGIEVTGYPVGGDFVEVARFL
jgi:hypothetical protein